ncbi:MAG: hypothetical protein NUV46_03675 [Nanoarchaeota archaeon]|nr:hypothetical protein [Nanoarchaeota archaeon]
MKKKSIKQKTLKEKTFRVEKSEIFYSLICYFVGVLAINLLSKGLREEYLLNPIMATEFLSIQILTLINVPEFLTLTIGFLLTLVPLVLGYIVFKEINKK